MVKDVNVLRTPFDLARRWVKYVSLTRVNAEFPAITPSDKIDRSRLAAATPKANPAPAEYENPIATLLMADQARSCLWLSLEDMDALRRRIRMPKYNGGAR
jgi:membrane-bound lytic murein transglycosylase B